MEYLWYIPNDFVRVNNKYSKHDGQRAQVIGCNIEEGTYLVKGLDCEFTENLRHYTISPIVLEEEHLEKNRWKYCDKRKIYYKDCTDGTVICLARYHRGINAWWVKIGDTLVSSNISSVHELQHILYGIIGGYSYYDFNKI